MQTKNYTGSTGGTDPFFRSNPIGSMNWNTEAASSVGTMNSTDLTILQDEMHTEALLYKKCSVYAGYFNDPALKSLAENAAEHHHRHFDSLHGYLNASN
jgi:hypothetical protein